MNDSARQLNESSIAQILVEHEAVNFRTDPFFRFTSGVESPIYVDNRQLLGYVEGREQILRSFGKLIQSLSSDAPFEAVAGTATAGIPWAAWIADRLKLPMMYVRSSAKGWGKERSVEGVTSKPMHVLLVEDLSYTAGSLASAAINLREHGQTVDHCVAILSYETRTAKERLHESGISLSVLTTIDEALGAATARGAITEANAAVVSSWLSGVR